MNPPHFLTYNNLIPFTVNDPMVFTILPTPYNSMPYSLPISYMCPSFIENQIQPTKKQQQKPEENFTNIRAERFIKRVERKAVDPDEYRTKEQNSQRNIMSNIAHHLMSFLKKSSQIRSILKKIIELHELNITCQQFFEFISRIQLKNYERWSTKYFDQGLGKAFRIMSYYFFSQKYFSWIQSSKKIKTSIKIQHMVKMRSLLKMLKAGI